jgi:hypothetical protein
VVHCGGQVASREQVAAIYTPPATESWHPIPHITLVEQVEHALQTLGMEITTSAFALAKEGLRFFGLMQVSRPDNGTRDYGCVVSLRNAHDRTWSVLMGVGSHAFVCDNLAFSSEIQVTRRHTSRVIIDLPNLVSQAAGQLAEHWTGQAARIEAYKQHELTDSQANDLIVRGYECGAAPITALADVIREWRTPRHPEFAEHKNVWRLFNGFSEALKGNLWALPKRTQALHALMDGQVGILGRQTAMVVCAN